MNTDFDLHIHTKLSDGEFNVKEALLKIRTAQFTLRGGQYGKIYQSFIGQ